MDEDNDQIEGTTVDFREVPGQPGQENFNAQAQRDKFLGGGGREEGKGSSFEERFQQGMRQYESLGGIINAVMVTPDNPKTTVPVVLAPGWSENTKVLKDCIAELYVSGRPVIGLDHPRRGGTVDPTEEYPIDELRKALTMQEIIKQENISQVDIIAHSEGAVNGAILASLEPENVRNMVLVNPAGLIGKDSIPGLVGRFAKKNVQNVISNFTDKDAIKAVIHGQLEGGKYFASNPLRAVQEVRAMSQMEIDDMLREIHGNGTGVVIIHGVDDPGFPMKKMQEVVKSDKQPNGFVDGFLSVQGGHDELYVRPEKYTGAAEQMLTALETKQANKQIAGQPDELFK